MHFVIFTSPSVEKGLFVSEALETADAIIAADCGANSALSLGIIPEAVIGDFDSISKSTEQKLKENNCRFITSPGEKDEIDTQIAITYAIKNGATKISLVGGVAGDRIDHTMANISLLYNPKIPLYLVNGPSKSWIVYGPQTVNITGKKNDILSLIPISQVVTNIQTNGLYYPLLNEPLFFGIPRGISNVFAEKNVSISFKEGMLLFVHTHMVKN